MSVILRVCLVSEFENYCLEFFEIRAGELRHAFSEAFTLLQSRIQCIDFVCFWELLGLDFFSQGIKEDWYYKCYMSVIFKVCLVSEFKNCCLKFFEIRVGESRHAFSKAFTLLQSRIQCIDFVCFWELLGLDFFSQGIKEDWYYK